MYKRQILNTALPTIATDLQTPVFEMQMAIIAYSLAVALFIPLTAWASVIVGSAIVNIVAEHGKDAPKYVFDYVKDVYKRQM